MMYSIEQLVAYCIILVMVCVLIYIMTHTDINRIYKSGDYRSKYDKVLNKLMNKNSTELSQVVDYFAFAFLESYTSADPLGNLDIDISISRIRIYVNYYYKKDPYTKYWNQIAKAEHINTNAVLHSNMKKVFRLSPNRTIIAKLLKRCIHDRILELISSKNINVDYENNIYG